MMMTARKENHRRENQLSIDLKMSSSLSTIKRRNRRREVRVVKQRKGM